MIDGIGEVVKNLTAGGKDWNFECSDVLAGLVVGGILVTTVVLKDEIKEVAKDFFTHKQPTMKF